MYSSNGTRGVEWEEDQVKSITCCKGLRCALQECLFSSLGTKWESEGVEAWDCRNSSSSSRKQLGFLLLLPPFLKTVCVGEVDGWVVGGYLWVLLFFIHSFIHSLSFVSVCVCV